MPEADERISHGAPTWFAGRGKVFATLDDHPGQCRVWRRSELSGEA
jgi:hypothetical protein